MWPKKLQLNWNFQLYKWISFIRIASENTAQREQNEICRVSLFLYLSPFIWLSVHLSFSIATTTARAIVVGVFILCWLRSEFMKTYIRIKIVQTNVPVSMIIFVAFRRRLRSDYSVWMVWMPKKWENEKKKLKRLKSFRLSTTKRSE